jgi:hypothetical protein
VVNFLQRIFDGIFLIRCKVYADIGLVNSQNLVKLQQIFAVSQSFEKLLIFICGLETAAL